MNMPLVKWRGSLTSFAGFYGTYPDTELKNAVWSDVVSSLAPPEPAIYEDKARGQYVVPCTLKDAPLVGKTLEKAIAANLPVIGKQRSASHVTEATLLIIDCDGLNENDFNNALTRIDQNDITYLSYTTHSHGSAEKPGVRARLVIPLDRPLNTEEYKQAWHGFDTMYLGGMAGKADPSGANLYQQQGSWCCHPDRKNMAKKSECKRGVASANDLIKTGINHLNKISVGHTKPSKHSLISTPINETAENIARVKSALQAIDADCNYDMWRNILWAVASTGWSCAEDIAREWSASAPERYTDEGFSNVWGSFDQDGGITLGTLFHYANEALSIAAGAEITTATAHGDTSGDIKNGRVFAYAYRDKLLFVHETGDVLKFEEETGWLHAPPGEADRAGKEVVAVMRAHAAAQWLLMPDDPRAKRLMKHVDSSSTESKIGAMIEMAKSEPGMTVRLNELDADPMMLGVANGVFDLRTGKLLRPTPELRITKRCPVPFDPDASAPILEAFIERITRGDPPLAKFLQRLAGYVLTGLIGEHCFAFLYGLGRNGKTTYAELLFWLLGEYAVILPTATLMMGKRDPGACSPDLMLLKGRRLALASELEESARFAEAAIKSMTGGDTMSARNPYGLFASWTPTHKLMIVGNHRPVISGGDHGIWRRVRLIPFNEVITDSECDGKLPEKLRADGAGVLNWVLAGLREWKKQGLNPPSSVKAAVAAYQTDMDILGEWMDEHVTQSPGTKTDTADLYRAYTKWAQDSGWKSPMTRPVFGRRLAERGILLGKTSGGCKCAIGICLNAAGQFAATGHI